MSEVKVNKISPRSGTEVTLGDSGDTFTIPSGATINNQGTSNKLWCNRFGFLEYNRLRQETLQQSLAKGYYFVDTTSQEIDVTLPAGTAGAVVAVKDYGKNLGYK